jgi:hypothetical protein
MIGFSGVKPMDNRDWMMQLPFVLINAAMAGLLGAAFNSLRMWLWRLRASKTQHCLRIGEVRGCCGAAGHIAGTFTSCQALRPLRARRLWRSAWSFCCAPHHHPVLTTQPSTPSAGLVPSSLPPPPSLPCR